MLIRKSWRWPGAGALLVPALGLVALVAGRMLGAAIVPKPVVHERSKADVALLAKRFPGIGQGVAVVEFLDFECPACRKVWPAVEAFVSAHPAVRYHAVLFPLPQHSRAIPAALVELMVEQSGKAPGCFSDFASGSVGLDQATLDKYLHSLGLSASDRKRADRANVSLRADEELAGKLKIGGTPTIMVTNGSRILEVYDEPGLSTAVAECSGPA